MVGKYLPNTYQIPTEYLPKLFNNINNLIKKVGGRYFYFENLKQNFFCLLFVKKFFLYICEK